MMTLDSIYPRPLLQRASFYPLNEGWTLNGLPINVPFPPGSPASGYPDIPEELEYRTVFSLPEGFCKENERLVLHFGAVDQICDIYLNDVHLIHHEGGYLPFSCDIGPVIRKENRLVVKAIDRIDPLYPYGKQVKRPQGMWYTPVSGIWQTVWIEAVPEYGIRDLKIHTGRDTLTLHVDTAAPEYTLSFPGHEQICHEPDITIHISEPHLWSPEDPYLYPLKIRTCDDEICSYFALRKITVKTVNGRQRIYLNDQPLFINGLLDQGYFEKGIYVPERLSDYEKDIRNIKELGYNCLRKHIKVEPEAFYYYCDLHGILVMQDMVNSGSYSFFSDTILPTLGLLRLKRPLKDRKRYDVFLNHCRDTIARLSSHPCIFAYTIYNEGWGQQAASDTYDILKPLDADRLFDATSGWSFDDHSDFDSYHVYFRNKVLKGREKILALSECGGFIREISDHRSKAGSSWGYGTTNSEKELTDKIITMHEKMVIPSIRNGLCVCIMTQISDVEGEINGLYTYDRKVCKVDKKRILAANRHLQEVYRDSCK